MKKYIVVALVTSFLSSLAGTAQAFPLDFTGDFRVQARMINDQINTNIPPKFEKKYWEYRTRLNFSGKVDQDTTFFGRFSVRTYQGLGAEVKSNNELDKFGVMINTNNWKLTLGRQAITIGQGAVLGTGDDASGSTNSFDGIKASTKLNNVDVTAFGGKNTSTIYSSAFGGFLPITINPINEWYGLDLKTKFSNNLSGGLSYAHKKPEKIVATNYTAVNATYNASPNFALNTEYVKSSSNDKKKGYFISGTYQKDKDRFTVQYNKIEANSVDSNSGLAAGPFAFKGADLPNGYKGFAFFYNHQVKKTMSLGVAYMDLKPIDAATYGSGSDNEFVTTLNWRF